VAIVWLIGDPHFGHKRIGVHRAQMGLDKLERNTETICAEWRERVHARDLVFVLGDAVVFDADARRIYNDLPGVKHLLLGNHDIKDAGLLLEVFTGLYGTRKYKGVWLSHFPVHPMELRGKGNIHAHTHFENVLDAQGREDPRYFNASLENVHRLTGRYMIRFDEAREIVWQGMKEAGHIQSEQQRTLLHFSEGLIGRKDAMRIMDVTYYELLDKLSEAGLELPSLPDKMIGQMAESMNRLLDEAEDMEP